MDPILAKVNPVLYTYIYVCQSVNYEHKENSQFTIRYSQLKTVLRYTSMMTSQCTDTHVLVKTLRSTYIIYSHRLPHISQDSSLQNTKAHCNVQEAVTTSYRINNQ